MARWFVLTPHPTRRAAPVQGRTVPDFPVSSLEEPAKQVMADHAVWKLSKEPRKVFLQALMHPPAPNAKLKGAYRRFRKYKTPPAGKRPLAQLSDRTLRAANMTGAAFHLETKRSTVADGPAVLGYYTLSAHSIERDALPEDVVKKLKLPRYPYVPLL